MGLRLLFLSLWTPKRIISQELDRVDALTTDALEALLSKYSTNNKEEKIKEEVKKKETLPEKKSTMAELEVLNVHELRKRARETEGFPIQGREISKANRRQLLDFFKKMI